MSFRLKEKALSFPEKAGVYFFKQKEKILYIGKAKNLKKRVLSYFGPALDNKTLMLVSKTDNIDHISLDSEFDAFLMEAALIKKYSPKYNIDLKDDKSYPFVKVTSEKIPLISVSRDKKGKALFIGPFTDVKLLKKITEKLNTVFKLRRCGKIIPHARCVYYQTKICSAPCRDKKPSKEYMENLNMAVSVIKGRAGNTLKKLEKKMKSYSMELKYEKAAFVRDCLVNLRRFLKADFYFKTSSRIPEFETPRALETLKKLLSLKKIPSLIEGYDISNTDGEFTAASKVSFYMGSPDKKRYRKFLIQTPKKYDDIYSLKQAVKRRFKHKDDSYPEAVLIDGGKGQLNAVSPFIPEGIAVLTLAKKNEEIYFGNKKIILEKNNSALKLLQRVRDEAHRFAKNYNVYLREKQSVFNPFILINGVGEKTALILYKKFKNPKNLLKYSVGEIAEKTKISEKKIKKWIEALNA